VQVYLNLTQALENKDDSNYELLVKHILDAFLIHKQYLEQAIFPLLLQLEKKQNHTRIDSIYLKLT
jgi:hypothetical protein